MIKTLLAKYKKSILYIMISLASMLAETVIGFLLLKVCGINAVIANAISIVLCSALHYIFVTQKVFSSKVGTKTAVIYVFTFVMGFSIQNFVMYVMSCRFSLFIDKVIFYAIAKLMSVVISFVLMYRLRKYLYLKI